MKPEYSATAKQLLERFPNKFLLSVSEIAQVIDCTPASVRARAFKMREGLPTAGLPPMRKDGARLVAHVQDVADWIDSRPTMQTEPHVANRRRRGRPSHGAKRAKKTRVVSVPYVRLSDREGD
jgi:hypothetical protein